MEVESMNIQLSSSQPQELLRFYRDVVGLEPAPELGEDALKVGGAHLLIDGHSEINGPAQEPARVLINLFVADLEAEQKRIEDQGVKFIRTAGREFWGGVISTFADPDGNYCQIIEFRPE